MEIKCPFWPICGAAEVRNLRGENYTQRFCQKEYLDCPHYQIRDSGPLARHSPIIKLKKES